MRLDDPLPPHVWPALCLVLECYVGAKLGELAGRPQAATFRRLADDGALLAGDGTAPSAVHWRKTIIRFLMFGPPSYQLRDSEDIQLAAALQLVSEELRWPAKPVVY